MGSVSQSAFLTVLGLSLLAAGSPTLAAQPINELLTRGQAALDQDNDQVALTAFTEALRLDPKNVTALVGRGTSLLIGERFDKAMADFQEAIRLDPKNSEAFRGRGIVRARKYDSKGAMADFEEAVRLNPKNGAAFRDRGSAYAIQGKPDEALADLNRAIQLDPKDAFALNNRCLSQILKGQIDLALTDCSEAINLRPKNAIFHWARGLAWTGKHEYGKAIEDMTEAIRLKPNYVKAYLARSGIYCVTKEFHKAIADGMQAIRLDPKNPTAFATRGYAYVAKGDFVKAIDDYSEMIRLDPKSAAGYMYRCQVHMSRGDFDKALADCDTIIRLDPKNAASYRARGSIYEAKGEAARAKEDYERFRSIGLAALLHELDLPPAGKQPKAKIEALEKRIREQVKALEYGDDVARDLVALVCNWDLVALEQKLTTARNSQAQGRMPKPQLVKVEQEVAEMLARVIEVVILPVDTEKSGHELTNVVRDKVGCCQGDSLLFFVLGNAIGLSVRGLEVTTMAGGPVPDGQSHAACLVKLADDLMITVDVTRNLGRQSLVSIAFRYDDVYHLCGSYWQLKDKSNPLGLHVTVRPTDVPGLISELYVVRASVCEQKADLDGVRRNLAEAVRRDPRCALTYTHLGHLHAQLGESEKAFAELSEAIKHDPSYATTYAARGAWHAACGKFDQAIADFGKALELNPKLLEALSRRGRVYAERGEFEKAKADFDLLLETDPKNAVGYVFRGYIWTKETLRDEALLASTNVAAANLYSAEAAKNTRTAEGEAANNQSKASVDTWAAIVLPSTPRLGLTLNVDKSMDTGQHALARSDNGPYDLSSNAESQLAIQNQYKLKTKVDYEYEKAVADFDKAIQFDAKLTFALACRGYVHARRGDCNKAIADLSRAIELDRKNVQCYETRSKVYELNGDLEKAIADLSEIIRLKPKSAGAYTARANLYARRHEIDKAAADFAEAQRLSPGDNRYR